MVYKCLNSNFSADFGKTDLNLPPITIDDRPGIHKRSRYTPDIPPYAIYVASENSFNNLTTPSGSPDLFTYDYPNTFYVMKKFMALKGRVNRVYYCRKRGQIRCYKKTRFY